MHKRILVGVTGGIAAYKSAELVRQLREFHAEVRVVMTAAATQFIGPLTLQGLSGHPVHTNLLDPRTESIMGHIELARWCDAVLVAPASANFLARLTHGFADDLLTTLCLASTAPLLVAPAMNRQMWAAAATQENLERLSSRGVAVLGPGTGDQACGEIGPGRMLEPAELLEYLSTIFQKNSKLSGIKVLVTAGPTREAIDPVRYISNLSSGKTGYALAQAATEAGACVTLVSGPVALERHPRVQFIDVTSAHEMYEAVMRIARQQDIVIAAAAVADYRSRNPAPQKIKKTDDVLTLVLERTPDILAAVAALDPRPFTVGFAAETLDLEKNALAKLHAKSLDMVVANQVGVAGTGFNSEENALHVFWPSGDREFSRAPKKQLAHQLIDLINERYREKNSTEDT